MDGNQAKAQDVQDQVVDGEAPAETGPVDLAQAFQLLRKDNEAPAEPAADQGEVSEEPGDDGAVAEDEPVVADEPAVQQGSGYAGGPAAPEPEYDYQALRGDIIADIKKQAQLNASKMFRENPGGEIRPVSLGDIYERREDGTVIFHNPDNPMQPFTSRVEAQAWVNSMNDQIKEGFVRAAQTEYQELLKQAMPAIRLVEFAPTFDKMDEASKQVFDQLIEPYGVYNNAGQVIGYNCNLPQMANQAINIAKSFRGNAAQQQQQVQQVQQQASEPAMDMRTGASQSPTNDEPKTLEEAFAMINSNKKGKKQ